MLGTEYYVLRTRMRRLINAAKDCREAQKNHTGKGGTESFTKRATAEKAMDTLLEELYPIYGNPPAQDHTVLETKQDVELHREGKEL